jgi:hypothetical protein
MNDTPGHPAVDEPSATGSQPDDAGAGQPVELSVNSIDLDLSGVPVGVGRLPNGNRVMVIGPVLVRFLMPFQPDTARTIARELAGGIEPASGLSPADQAAARKLIVPR